MQWWQMIIVALSSYSLGVIYTRNNTLENTSQDKIAQLQDQISLAHEKINHIKSLWVEAEQRAETWERRYNALIPEAKEM